MERKRERETLIPAFDPQELAHELETELANSSGGRATEPPPFDTQTYARIVDANIAVATDARDTPRTLTAATPVSSGDAGTGASRAVITDDVEAVGREMYGSYLESNFPEALVLAERVLEKEPEHSLAQLVADRCRAMLTSARPPDLHPSSIVRLRQPPEGQGLTLDTDSMFVLAHVTGEVEAAAVADLAGIPRDVAMDHLHALLDLGFLEVVNG